MDAGKGESGVKLTYVTLLSLNAELLVCLVLSCCLPRATVYYISVYTVLTSQHNASNMGTTARTVPAVLVSTTVYESSSAVFLSQIQYPQHPHLATHALGASAGQNAVHHDECRSECWNGFCCPRVVTESFCI